MLVYWCVERTLRAGIQIFRWVRKLSGSSKNDMNLTRFKYKLAAEGVPNSAFDVGRSMFNCFLKSTALGLKPQVTIPCPSGACLVRSFQLIVSLYTFLMYYPILN